MNYGITAKAAMYAIPLFLTPFADGLKELLTRGEWPSAPLFVYCSFLGTIQMCVGLRAFYDGSAERHKSEVKAADLEPETPDQRTQQIAENKAGMTEPKL